MSNAANIPAEIVEQEYPLRVTRYSLEEGTGGTGRFPGAPAVVREYQVLAPDTTVNLRLERTRFQPPGAEGGEPGSYATCTITTPDGQVHTPAGKSTQVVQPGTVIRVRLASGGGFGESVDSVTGRERAGADA